jgi:deoxyribonuclease-4
MASRKSSTRKRRAPKRKARPAAPRAKSQPRRRSRPEAQAKSKPAKRRPAPRIRDSADNPSWVAPAWDDDLFLGAHVSIAGGTHEAPRRARAIGATAMQIFTKMASRWAERTCEVAETVAFRGALARTRVGTTIVHDSYLINLASPDATLLRRSIESFVAELARCEALGVDLLVSHPGNYIDDRASGLQRNADGIAEALSRVPGRTVVCLESTAGSGTVLGSTFEELAALIDAVPRALRSRLGVCVDTCHAYSAGYDLVDASDDVWKRFDDVVGAARLRVLHLNDSKTRFGSRRDRHELIGEGSLGERAFRQIMNDERLATIPKVLETPKGEDPTATDARMLARLRSYTSP